MSAELKRYVCFAAVAVVTAAIILSVPTAALWAWHGTGGPTGTGVASGPTFSNALAPVLPGRGYRTCLLGNFRALDPSYVPIGGLPNPGHTAEHHWKYLSRISGSVTLLLTVQSFNTTSDPGKTMTLTATHAFGANAITVPYPSVAGPAGEVSSTLTVPVAGGVPYDFTVTVHQAPGDPDPHNAGSVHYRIGVLGPGASQVELGYGQPTLEYQEPAPDGLYRWAVNVAPGETAALEVSVDPGALVVNPFVPPQAGTITYSVHDPSLGSPPPIIIGPVTAGVSVSSPHVINITNSTFAVKTYILRMELPPPGSVRGHFKLTKLTNPDSGIYAMNCPESGIVGIDIKPGSFPNSINLGSGGSVPVAIFSRPEFDATTIDPATVTLAGAGIRLTGRGFLASQEDVNGDGLLDLVVHIQTDALDLTTADSVAVLRGLTFSGNPVIGADSIRVVQ